MFCWRFLTYIWTSFKWIAIISKFFKAFSNLDIAQAMLSTWCGYFFTQGHSGVFTATVIIHPRTRYSGSDIAIG